MSRAAGQSARAGGAVSVALAAVLAAVAGAPACSGGQAQVIPQLPGSGAGHTAPPRATGASKDPWAGHDLIRAPSPVPPHPLTLPKVQRFTLRNGLPVLALESSAAPTFFGQLAVKAGRQNETRDKVGLASFAAQMLTRGSRGQSAQRLNAAMEKAGAQLSANASFEATLITCHAPDRGATACLRAMSGLASAPTFPAAAINDVRQALEQTANQAHAEPGQLANMHFQNALWGDEQVRGWPMSMSSVAAIQRADLVAWHRAYFAPDNAVFLVVSDLPPAQLKTQLNRTLGRWRAPRRKKARAGGAGSATPGTPSKPPGLSGLRVRLIDLPGLNQAQIRVGHFGLAHRDPDFFAATVVNQVLGGSAETSRLGRVLQASFGKQVAVSSSFDRNLARGSLVVAAAAPSDKAVAVAQTLIGQIGKMQSAGPTDQEVTAAITELVGSYETRLESVQQIGSALLAAALHGLGPEYVRNFGVELGEVTGQAARASAARRLDGKNLVVVIAGDAVKIEPQLKAAGFTYTKLSHNQPVAKYERDELAAQRAKPVDPHKAAAARAVLEAALAAKGGAARLLGLKTLLWKGTAQLHMPGGNVPAVIEKRYVAPDKLRLDMKLTMNNQSLTITTVLDGNKGWAQETRSTGSRAMEFPPGEVEAGKGQIWRDQDLVLLRHREKGARIEPLDDVNIDGTPNDAIRVTSADGKHSVVLFIDKKTHHLSGMAYTEQGVTAEERYSDYRTVSGISVARTRSTKSAQINLTAKVTDVKINQKVDPKLFVKPAGARAPTRPTGKKPPPGLPGGAAPPAK